ncbi:MAG: hypothetical protein SF029_02870 [bacterium]|nr:hypothetical protein [bacterium]
MSDQSDVIVKLDDRVRLMSAVLAATNFPEKAQQVKRHGTHAHARATRKYVSEHNQHPAVQSTQALLDQGTPLEALFTLALLLSWPELHLETLPRWVPAGYSAHLRDFYLVTRLDQFWQSERVAWDKALKESNNVFNKVDFKTFLKPFLGDISETFTFIPTVSFPADRELGLKLGKEIVCLAPPPLAWGESPPWAYDEPTQITMSIRAALTVYARILLLTYLRSNAGQLAEISKNDLPISDQFKVQHPTWEDQFAALFCMAVVAMYLESHVNEAEYKAYVLIEKKARGQALLPGTISVMRRYLQEKGSNKYSSLIEFLPFFPKQLRVAQKIVTL